MNKKGRKYDRNKWGWGSESKIPKDLKEYNHSYEDKHPYYDSDRKQKAEEFSMNVIFGCMVGIMVLIFIILFI